MIREGNEKIAAIVQKKNFKKEDILAAHMLVSAGVENSITIKENIARYEEEIIKTRAKIEKRLKKN